MRGSRWRSSGSFCRIPPVEENMAQKKMTKKDRKARFEMLRKQLAAKLEKMGVRTLRDIEKLVDEVRK